MQPSSSGRYSEYFQLAAKTCLTTDCEENLLQRPIKNSTVRDTHESGAAVEGSCLPRLSWGKSSLRAGKTESLVTLKMRRYVPPKGRFFLQEPHGVISQKIPSFIVTEVKNIPEDSIFDCTLKRKVTDVETCGVFLMKARCLGTGQQQKIPVKL
jgi:hypothetical protein